MTFQNIEPSNPAYTRDGLHFLTMHSEALGQRATMCVYIPPGLERTPGLPMVLLLHGIYGNHWSWPYLGGAHLRAGQLIDAGEIRPMGMVMPSDGLHGAGSGYLKHPGRDCERWVIEEALGCAREQYPCFSGAPPTFVAGFSMGGFGALRLGARYAALFRGISGHSSVTSHDLLSIFQPEGAAPEPYLTEEDISAIHWMRRHRDRLPPIRFDCGIDDRLYKYNVEFHEDLVREGIPHVFESFPGTHSWAYCHEHIADTLRFFDGILKGGK